MPADEKVVSLSPYLRQEARSLAEAIMERALRQILLSSTCKDSRDYACAALDAVAEKRKAEAR